MKILVFFLFLLLTTFLSCNKNKAIEAGENTFNKTELLTTLANNYIIKRLNDFNVSLEELELAATEFNNSPTLTTLDVLKNKWKLANEIWKECELFNIGEVKDTYAHLRIETRPENQNFIESNIADTAVLDNLYFENIGFSSKGLAAIEYLLFHHTESVVLSEFSQVRRKLYLTLSIGDVSKNLDLILNTWSDSYIQVFKQSVTPGITSSINIIVNKLVELNEKVYQTKLGFPLGKNNGIIEASNTESPLSKSSLSFINHNLISIEQTFETGLYNYLDYLKLEKNSEPLSGVIKSQIQTIKTKINLMSSLEDSILNDYSQSEELYNEFKELLILLKVDVISGLNIIFVINDNDGD